MSTFPVEHHTDAVYHRIEKKVLPDVLKHIYRECIEANWFPWGFLSRPNQPYFYYIFYVTVYILYVICCCCFVEHLLESDITDTVRVCMLFNFSFSWLWLTAAYWNNKWMASNSATGHTLEYSNLEKMSTLFMSVDRIYPWRYMFMWDR